MSINAVMKQRGTKMTQRAINLKYNTGTTPVPHCTTCSPSAVLECTRETHSILTPKTAVSSADLFNRAHSPRELPQVHSIGIIQ